MCSIPFNDKPYQEINFKCHLSSDYLLDKKNIVRFAHLLCDFTYLTSLSLYCTLLDFAHFCNEFTVWVHIIHKTEKLRL